MNELSKLSDAQLASTVRMLMRDDLMHEPVVCSARDRILKLSGELERWKRAYEDAYHALRHLNTCCGQEVSEYQPPDSTQRVLGLNGKVHSVDGWEVPQPMHDEN